MNAEGDGAGRSCVNGTVRTPVTSQRNRIGCVFSHASSTYPTLQTSTGNSIKSSYLPAAALDDEETIYRATC